MNAKQYTVVDALKEMMAGWNAIEARAKADFPNATKEELYKICESAMKHALKIS